MVREKEKEEKEKIEELHQQEVTQMSKSAERSAGLLHKITEPTAWRGGPQILKKAEDARLLDNCEAKKKAWAKHWQCNEDVQNFGDKALEKRRIEESRGSAAKAKRVRTGKCVEIVQSKDRSGM